MVRALAIGFGSDVGQPRELLCCESSGLIGAVLWQVFKGFSRPTRVAQNPGDARMVFDDAAQYGGIEGFAHEANPLLGK